MTKAGFRLLLVLAAFFAADAGWTHSDMDKPLYVATAGVDEGRCQDPANPCRTLAYALNRVGKGGQVRVAGGTYQLSDAAAIFQVISGITDIRGGFAADNQFLAPAGLPTLITGMPYQYRAQVQSLGFHLVADQKGTNSNTLRETRAMLKQNQALQAGLPAAACIGGSVSGLSCQNTDLLAHVPFSAVSGNPGAAADIWGFVDLNTNREYALVSYNNGTAVFDVTDPTEPAEIGFVAGQNTVWRDIKVYQYFDETDQRWHAFAYVTADGTSEGLFVLDLRNLPHSISRASYTGDFGAAHNVFAINTDYGTGLSRTGANPSLVIAGSNNGFGRFRVYSLVDPASPSFNTIANSSDIEDMYMHDAASMIIRDQRKDTQCVNATDYCEVLFDFNESTVDVWDITDTANPVRLSRTPYTNSGYTHSGWPSEDGQYLFVHDELDEQQSSLQTTVRTFSLADLENPTLVGTWTGPSAAIDHNGFVRGNRYYMSNYSRGLTILDLTNPATLQSVGFLDTYQFSDSANFVGAWGAYPYFHSGNIGVSDMTSGFYMIGDDTLDSPAGQITFSATSYAGAEGGPVAVTLRRINGSAGAVNVSLQPIPATADAADFIAMPSVASWSDGDTADKTIVFDTAVDGVSEGLERLLVRLIAPTGGATITPLGAASIFVADIGAATVVEFDRTSITASERGFGKAVITFQRRGTASGNVSVDYSISNGDAIDGTDFTGATSGTISWDDGDANPVSVEFNIVDDGTVEGNEFIELALGSPVGATIGQASTLQITILDGTGSNRAPNSVAGGGQIVSGGTTVTLDGASSNDPDGDTLTYQWTQLLGQSVAINNATSARATFVAPNVSSDTVLQFQLQVFDPAGLNDVSTTNVTVRASTGNSGGNEGGGGGGVLLHLLALLLAVTAMRRGRFTRTDAA